MLGPLTSLLAVMGVVAAAPIVVALLDLADECLQNHPA